MSNPSLEVQLLVKCLQWCHTNGDTATYEKLSGAIHNDVLKHRSWLTSARNICLRDYGLDFDVLPRIGYRPIKREDVAAIATDTAQRKIRGATRKWRDRLDCVAVETLQGDSLNAHVSSYFKLELQERVVNPDLNKAIDQKVSQQHLTGRAGLDYARDAARKLFDVS